MRRLIPKFIRKALVRARIFLTEFDLEQAEIQRCRIHSDIGSLRQKRDRLRRDVSRIDAGLA
ncbi:MAG: hypothetical protein KGP14_00865 [Betaproteobacteria bacterium]|nr:hypothetical protein [Betaproteobacteria bacterium]